jgi:hypothetical protein
VDKKMQGLGRSVGCGAQVEKAEKGTRLMSKGRNIQKVT